MKTSQTGSTPPQAARKTTRPGDDHSLGARLMLLATVVVLGLLTLAVMQLSSPLVGKRAALLWALIGAIGVGGWRLARAGRRRWARGLVVWSLCALTVASVGWGHMALSRRRVLVAPDARLARWSRHLVVGYKDVEELAKLLQTTELAGIYITARNVRGRSVAAVRAELDRLQAIQRRRGGAPLWVMADQEGGEVARLSPPLPAQPALGRLIAAAERRRRGSWPAVVRVHARRQARQLRSMGVTMNLSPVVDLRVAIERRLDLHTRLEERAIASAPRRVAAVAELYARTLWRHGVLATAKHFPGLGYVAEDTHHLTGRLQRSEAELRKTDWLPFARLARADFPSAVMVAHVVVPAIDPHNLTSSSPAMITRLRQGLGHRGLIITDDMCMGPVYYSKGGIAARARDALAAGVDLILISHDPRQVYPTLSALAALPEARVPRDALAASRRRLREVR
jgi:beta-N-acetylhexosaminidase